MLPLKTVKTRAGGREFEESAREFGLATKPGCDLHDRFRELTDEAAANGLKPASAYPHPHTPSMSSPQKIGGEIGEVRANIDIASLNAYLASHVPVIRTPVTVKQFKVCDVPPLCRAGSDASRVVWTGTSFSRAYMLSCDELEYSRIRRTSSRMQGVSIYLNSRRSLLNGYPVERSSCCARSLQASSSRTPPTKSSGSTPSSVPCTRTTRSPRRPPSGACPSQSPSCYAKTSPWSARRSTSWSSSTGGYSPTHVCQRWTPRRGGSGAFHPSQRP